MEEYGEFQDLGVKGKSSLQKATKPLDLVVERVKEGNNINIKLGKLKDFNLEIELLIDL